MWTYILIFGISALVLIKAGGMAVKSLSKIALFLNWGEFTTAFLLMAVTTSLPELFVGISAAIHGTPELSFGNIIGSNIINLTLVIAITLIFTKRIKAESSIVQKTSIYTVFIVFLPFILMFDKTLSRIDGLILFVVLGAYLYRLLKRRAKFKKVLDYSLTKDWIIYRAFFKNIGFFLFAVFLLIISAEGIVRSASVLATGWGVSLLTIGIILVALGTNLPEIVFGIKAVSLGHKDMILGNLMGSVVINTTLVLGTTVLISPMYLSSLTPYAIGILFSIIAVILFAIFTRSHKTITRREGLILFIIYITFIFMQFLLT